MSEKMNQLIEMTLQDTHEMSLGQASNLNNFAHAPVRNGAK